MQVSAIVLAAGEGLRVKSKIPKPLIEINSRPMIVYSLEAFSRHPQIKEVIVVINSQNRRLIEEQIAKYRIIKVKKVVLGGKERQDSLGCGLKAVDKNTALVLIHDAARPFVEKKLISRLIIQAQKSGAAIAGVPVKATIKLSGSGNIVKKTLKRSKLWEIQTPQVFKKSLIFKAYKKFSRIPVTDDASLVERLGVKVVIVPASYANIKITTPEDLLVAKSILSR